MTVLGFCVLALPIRTRLNHGLKLHQRVARRRTTKRARFTMDWKPAGLLRDYVRNKEEELEPLLEMLESRPDHPLNLRLGFFSSTPSYRLTKAIRRSDGTLAVIPMIKRVELGQDLKLRAIAPLEDIRGDTKYLAGAGADAFFVNTDTRNSMVSMGDLTQIAENHIVARHDLIIHPVQIAEAVEAGAGAVIIVAGAVLEDLMELLNAATAMGVEAVVECHTQIEVEFAVELGATILLLTNRSRAEDRIVPGTAVKLREMVPDWLLTIAGGGLVSARDCWECLDAGFNAVTLGKALLQSPSPKRYIDEIRSEKSLTMDPFAGRFENPFAER